MTRLRGTLIAAAVPLFLLAACAQPGTDAGAPVSSSPESASPSGDGLVARVESFGGFVPPDRTIGTLPALSIYADGRVITEGPVPAIYPGPALPNLQVLTFDAAQVQQIVQEASAAGVKPGTDFGRPNVADAPTTRVTVTTDQGVQSVNVVALNEAQVKDPLLTDAQQKARATLAAYVKKLQDLASGDGYTASKPYEPTSLAVLARPWTKQSGGEPAQADAAWPGPALPGDYVNPAIKIGCVVVTGADLDKVMTAARKANQMTPWTAGDQKYLINFRPLLPDEKGCAEFKGNR
ncbi:hypothetical protein Aab01nite_14960 [Paractinoplanes abujensis]|uniref:Uncharacterized protein n=1 Tax=Paractinoplanes abujensis TaxID=882441 RepID=A0A7W7CPU0_9ACTN|nr:hypothetical protein [Actinoplanes abujensis]MBB4690681.1 hypothetical protein [Actinoplanes abujensis]GID17906.1 hypothetical protein Aab01nite_14960 [Actinoplanes abujensis]